MPKDLMQHNTRFLCFVLSSLLLIAASSCGGDATGSGVDDAADASSPVGDGGPSDPGADGSTSPPVGCVPGAAACNNCLDDDGDGKIDGADPECTGSLDDDEATFATGIPGDNKDAKNQDCFFDGDSGAGNDGCAMPTCCLFSDPAECPAEAGGPGLPAGGCPEVSDKCLEECTPLVPPGCDCFSCCTICNGEGCHDVLTNPAVAPDCTAERASDPSVCPSCTKVAGCEVSCEGDSQDCVLCPGETENDLPATCSGNECPGGASTCTTSIECGDRKFCSNGCCIAVVE